MLLVVPHPALLQHTRLGVFFFFYWWVNNVSPERRRRAQGGAIRDTQASIQRACCCGSVWRKKKNSPLLIYYYYYSPAWGWEAYNHAGSLFQAQLNSKALDRCIDPELWFIYLFSQQYFFFWFECLLKYILANGWPARYTYCINCCRVSKVLRFLFDPLSSHLYIRLLYTAI